MLDLFEARLGHATRALAKPRWHTIMSTTIQRDAAIVHVRQISTAADYDALIERASRRQLVLIGEASHGTHEFCETRANIRGGVRRRDGGKPMAGVQNDPTWLLNREVLSLLACSVARRPR
jgi:hypothetical protein